MFVVISLVLVGAKIKKIFELYAYNIKKVYSYTFYYYSMPRITNPLNQIIATKDDVIKGKSSTFAASFNKILCIA